MNDKIEELQKKKFSIIASKINKFKKSKSLSETKKTPHLGNLEYINSISPLSKTEKEYLENLEYINSLSKFSPLTETEKKYLQDLQDLKKEKWIDKKLKYYK